MRRGALLAGVVVLFWGSQARADLPVIDFGNYAISIQSLGQALKVVANGEAQVANQAIELVRLKAMVESVMHGDVLAVTQLGPELRGLGLGDLVDPSASGLEVLSGAAGIAAATSRLSAMADQMLAQDSYYLPTGSDWSASRLVAEARAAATQKALAEASAQQFQGQIASLRATRDRAAAAGDVTSAAQANAVIAGIQAQATMEGNQLRATSMFERAQERTLAAQNAQRARCSYERLVANARAAQSAADAGQVQFLTDVPASCASAAVAPPPAVADQDGTLASASDASVSVSSGYDQYLGQSVGTGQCVALVQQADPSIGRTATWAQGQQVQGASDLQPGTAIATFNAAGRYANATDGSSHAAIYLGQTAAGLQVEDQWLGQPAHVRTIPFNSGGTAANNGSAFYVVSHNA